MLPPKLAPIQVVIVPIYKNDQEQVMVMEVVNRLQSELGDFRVHVDNRTELMPGFKFNDWEMRGVPLRVEVGPKDVAKGTVVFSRRDVPGREGKSFVPHTQIASQVVEMLRTIQESLFQRALTFRETNTLSAETYTGLTEAVQDGWALSWWCGSAECEAKVKDDTKATTRCIPIEQEDGSG
jgi:prolyl-tRNA synthetase